MAMDSLQSLSSLGFEFLLKEINEERQLKPGDHICVEGTLVGARYCHHGIYLGPKVGVADFGATRDNGGKRITSLSMFTEGFHRKTSRVTYAESVQLPAEETIRRATALIGNEADWPAFDVTDNNCEHFAVFCKTGQAESDQVALVLSNICEHKTNFIVMAATKVYFTLAGLFGVNALSINKP